MYEAPVFSPLSETSQADEENSFTSDDDKLERPLAIATEHTIVTSQEDEHSLPYGYKLVGDNVDKNVKPSLQRYEMRSQSLHHFHSFAVRDRVPIEALSHSSPVHSAITIASIPTPDPQKLLPTPDDMHYIKDEMCILLSR